MTYINVNFASLAEAAAQLQSSHGALTGHVDEMNRLLGGLRETWQGDTGLGWQGTQAAWNETAAEVFAILSNLHKAVNMSLDNYTATHRGLTQMWSA